MSRMESGAETVFSIHHEENHMVSSHGNDLPPSKLCIPGWSYSCISERYRGLMWGRRAEGQNLEEKTK